MWDAFFAIARKEFVQAWRGRGALRMLLILQTMDFVMMAWIDLSIRNMPTVIVDQDHSAESRDFVERLAATNAFDLKYATSSVTQAREHVRAGHAMIAIVIPPDFSRRRAMNQEAQVLALIDGSNSTVSSQATAAFDGVASRVTVELRQETLEPVGTVEAHTSLLFNPQGSIPNYMLPGLLSIVLGNAYPFFTIFGLLMERVSGNLERLLMTPMRYEFLIIGKILPWFLLGILNSILYLLIIHFGFHVPVRGSVPLLIGVCVLYTLACLALGSMIAAGAHNPVQAITQWTMIVIVAFAVSGYLFPLSSLPKFLLPVSYVLPHTHFVELMRGICLRDASARELAPDLIYMIVAPIVFIVGAARRFGRSVME